MQLLLNSIVKNVHLFPAIVTTSVTNKSHYDNFSGSMENPLWQP